MVIFCPQPGQTAVTTSRFVWLVPCGRRVLRAIQRFLLSVLYPPLYKPLGVSPVRLATIEKNRRGGERAGVRRRVQRASRIHDNRACNFAELYRRRSVLPRRR